MGVDNRSMQWDIFCRVIDNHGDLGVCWRLAHDLAEHGDTVRLWIDDPTALSWMAPLGHRNVAALQWQGSFNAEPHEAVVEAFGCHPPEKFVARMAAAAKPPVWINLEYLSAEPHAARSHGLPSPQQSGPGRGLVKWFYFPGVRPGTGGLIREATLPIVPSGVRRATRGVRATERAVSVFAYADAPFAELFDRLDTRPTLLLLCAGVSQGPALSAFDAWGRRGTHLRCRALPYMTQAAYDELLADCDLNLVRGEDSLVRAFWAGKPFVWQAYRQDDRTQAAKVDAMLHAMNAADDIGRLWRSWNRLGPWPDAGQSLPDPARWAAECSAWRESLWQLPNLTDALRSFVASKQ
jgi:uncharacterized repeat protein (TIGR03837 family)